jgi:hypothetical protein
MNIIQRLRLKQNDPEGYKNWKYLKRINATKHLLQAIPDVAEPIFKHSGNAGDIIYTLPVMYALAKQKDFHIALDIAPIVKYGKNPHPLGDKMLTPKMVAMLQPLLNTQQQIKSCSIIEDKNYTVDLDLFRELPLYLDRGNIARWHFWVWGVNYDVSKTWLNVAPNTAFKDSIVLARSQRYNQPGIDYGFLQRYNNVYFVGVEVEYQLMKQQIPNLEFAPVNDFNELASIIAGSKLFIGNQSFPFSLAEGLKVNRLLEVYHLCPNVCVYGENGFDFYFQNNFEKLVVERYENR